MVRHNARFMMNHSQRTPPVRPSASHPRPLEHTGYSRRLAVAVRAMGVMCLLACSSGCGLFSSGQQLKQLQMENDRLLSEYRSQRERVASLQETNAALEARVGEAERLLAQVGKTLPSSRISRAPQRGNGAAPSSNPPASPPSGAAPQSAPPYVPPTVPSLPGPANAGATGDAVQWRPMRRQ